MLIGCVDGRDSDPDTQLVFGDDTQKANNVDAGQDTAVSDLSVEDTAVSDLSVEDTGPDWVEDTAPTPEDVVDPQDAGPPEDIQEPDPTMFINEGFIGGTCDSDNDCAYDGGFCFEEGEGFPDGMCSLPCDLYCPDQEGMVTTFCIDAESAEVDAPPGLCTMRCDFSQSESGCRAGYKCVLLPRHNDPNTVVQSCIPEDVEGPEPVDPSTCQQQLIDLGISFTIATNPKDSPKDKPNLICDIQDPIKVTGTMHGVNYRYSSMDKPVKAMFMTCPLALALEKTALILSENGVSDVLHWGVYNCRVISGTNTLSQHGLANAIDIRSLVTDAGEVYEVLTDWEKNTDVPMTEAGEYLKWFAQSLYTDWIFNVILTPDYNAAHKDHFHVDLTPGSHFLQ